MKKSIKRSAFLCPFALVLLFISQNPLFAQYTAVENFMKEYPGENGVVSYAKEYFELSVGKDGISIVSTYEKQSTYFNENAHLYSSEEIGSSDFYKVSEIEAYSMVPENGKYNRENVTEFKTSSDQSDGVFFDDSKLTTFYFPNLQKNAQSVLKYKKTCNDPHLLPKVFLGSYFPIAKKEVELCIDKGIDVSYKLMNCDSLDISFSTYTKGNKTYMKWTANHIDAMDAEENAPSMLYNIPHIILYIRSYQEKDSVVNVFDNAQHFFEWSYGFVKEAIEPEFPSVKHFSDSLLSNTGTTLEKIKKTYAWVQDNIRYVAFEEGYAGFKPRLPDLVLSRRYGDCKDMAALLNKMLNSQNIKSYLAWVGTRDLPYQASEIAVPGIFNHVVVAAYDDDGKEYILDPTSNYLFLPYPSKAIQGKELVLCVDSIHFKIITAPKMAKETNTVNGEITMNISEGRSISGSGTYTQTGYLSMIFRDYYEYYNEDEKNKFVKNNVASGNNKFIITNLSHSDLALKQEPLVTRFDFSMADYIHLNGNETYVNLNIRKTNLNIVELKDRKYDLENDFNYLVNDRYILNIPAGYKVKYLPPDISFTADDYGFSFKYTSTSGQVVLERSLYVNYLLLPMEKIIEWNNFVKKLNAGCSETIVLSTEKVNGQ